MAEIVPAVLADTPQAYKKDLDLATSLSDRVQIDLADGKFADNLTVSLAQVYWPELVKADLHLMYDDPAAHTPSIISLKPNLAIIHAEAAQMTNEKVEAMLSDLSSVGIKTGLALLGPTSVESIRELLGLVDHVMVFTGELGHYGGQFDTSSLAKIGQIKSINPGLEVGVDGGITPENAAEVVAAGADVLNVGSYLQQADDPEAAYDRLKSVIS